MGQSGQAITLFQITPYVNDFQTLNNTVSWQPVGVSKKVIPSILTQIFHQIDDGFRTTVLNERMWHFRGCGQNILWPSDIFSGVNTPNSQDLHWDVVLEASASARGGLEAVFLNWLGLASASLGLASILPRSRPYTASASALPNSFCLGLGSVWYLIYFFMKLLCSVFHW